MLIASQTNSHQPPSSWKRVHVEGTASLACSHFHLMALGQQGAYSWGGGLLGVLGHGGESDELMPRMIDALQAERISCISCGAYHSAAASHDGKLFVWGWGDSFANEFGALDEAYTSVPRLISLGGTTRVKGISCGCFATAAWDVGGQLYTWGRGESGQLGHGTCDTVVLPRPVEALTGVLVVQVAWGGVQTSKGPTGFMLACSASGAAFTCGSPIRGRLGRPFTLDGIDRNQEYLGYDQDVPVHYALPGQIRGELSRDRGSTTPVARVAASDNHAALLSDSGALFVWGSAEGGVLGGVGAHVSTDAIGFEGSKSEAVLEPVLVHGLPILQDVVCTAFNTVLLASSGEVLFLGGEGKATTMPRRANLPRAATAIFGGGFHLGVVLPGDKGVAANPDDASRADRRLRASPLIGAAGPEMAELLLADVVRGKPHQVRHELQMLREILRAERIKLKDVVRTEQARRGRG